MAQIEVIDADNARKAVELPPAPGRAAAAGSRPVVLSNEDLLAINAITTALGLLGTQTTLAAVLAKLSADPATQTTLAAILAKLIAAPATEAKQDTGNTSLASIITALATNHTDEVQLHADIGTTLLAKEEAIRALLAGTLTVGTHAVTGTFWQATQPVSAASLPLPTGAGTAANQATIITALATNHTDEVQLHTDIATTLHADLIAATPAGSNLIGRAVADASAATGGIASTARMASAAASTNATNVKTSAGRIYSACGKNNAAYDVFLVLYDSAVNPPVPGTTTIRKKIPCPAGQAFVYDFPLGLSFANGIGYAFTKLVADADTTVLVAADITAFNLDYV
jgi:hypothetical protein